jgi:hypothetical protein
MTAGDPQLPPSVPVAVALGLFALLVVAVRTDGSDGR